jgi:hypothetical protein
MHDLIAGTWELESFNIIEPTGLIRPWGQNTTGLLLYNSDGYMSVSINRAVDTIESNSAKDLFDSILFYAGTYSIKINSITHKVTNASNPSRIGKEMIRHANLQDGMLELKSPVETFGQAVLVWRKIS